jgi:transcriptional regulator with XRE-family HTH domain
MMAIRNEALCLEGVIDNKSKERPIQSPLEAIRQTMKQKGLVAKDLVPILGSASRVSEVLKGKRKLSIAMIRALNGTLGIDANILIQDVDENAPRDMSSLDECAFFLSNGKVSKPIEDRFRAISLFDNLSKDIPLEELLQLLVIDLGGPDALPKPASEVANHDN